MANTIVPMLGVSDAWSFMIVGILSMVALLAYARGGHSLSVLSSRTRLLRHS